MKPYYEEPGITIYCADCRDVLPHLPKVDLVLTDPPYGIALESHRGSRWSVIGDETQDVGLWALHFLHKIPAVTFANPMRPWPGPWGQFLVWDKGPALGGGADPARYWKLTWELIQVRMLGVLHGQRDSAVLRYWATPQMAALHPCQKPLPLIRYLLGKVCAPVILDPFMGSGTTLVAAKQLGRRAIGIEIERKYCDIAIERLRQEVLPLEPEQPEPEQMSL